MQCYPCLVLSAYSLDWFYSNIVNYGELFQLTEDAFVNCFN